MIFGMICMRSSELFIPALLTARVAASTTEVIWELVRLLESVLLVFREESLACLELLVEERLALSSLITAEEREVAVVSDVVEAELLLSSYSSSLSEQPETRINNINRIENEKRFEKLFFPTLLDIKINLSIFNT